MTDTRIDATALEALAMRVEAGETGREIDACIEEWAFADLLSKCEKVTDSNRDGFIPSTACLPPLRDTPNLSTP